MPSPDGDQNFDEWTAMPSELGAEEVAPLIVAPPAGKSSGRQRLDLGSLVWKYVAAGSYTTPAAVLAVLAADERVQIRRRCAENPNTNGDTLAFLAEDKVDAVRVAVAKNRHTPLYALRKLAHDQSEEVRFAIASNRQMPDAILLSLFMDPDPTVAERASQTLNQ